MSCEILQEHLDAYRLGELEPDLQQKVGAHLATCGGCRDLLAAFEMIAEAGSSTALVEPPADLQGRLTATGCERWLGLLFKAVDRELGEESLSRLLSHLESCPACRSAWNDLTLMHQVADAISPPPTLLQRCLTAGRSLGRPRVLGRRTVIAAAYVLALLIGPPVTLARHEAASVVEHVTTTISQELSDIAADGRGEARVMLWRTWRWTRDHIAAARRLLTSVDPSSGAPDATSDATATTDSAAGGDTDEARKRSGPEPGGSDG